MTDSSPATDAPATDAPPSDAHAADASPKRPKLGTLVGKVARMIHPEEGSLPKGDQAALRRTSPDDPITPALWKVLYGLNIHDPEDDARHDNVVNAEERNWGVLLIGLSYCAGLHDYDVPLGKALAQAGWSETRFVRLLEADRDTLPTLIRRMAQYLASKQQPANWADVAYLLFTRDSEKAEAIRLRIARHYYRTLHAKANE